MEQKWGSKHGHKGCSFAAAKGRKNLEKKRGKKAAGADESEREESKAARSWTWTRKKEGKEGGNLGILFFRFYLLKLMSFFWFNLRNMCN